MMRSLFSGVSGLKNHQIRMDVIGNNISNVNTVGFKSERVTFKDIISQTIQGASPPKDNVGGTNPKQIGLGMQVAAIDKIMTQGSLQTTDKNTDLAITGEGFFIVNNGDKSFYTRAGNFDVDKEGKLVDPGNGFKVQGWNANIGSDGSRNIITSSDVEDIIIPLYQKEEAKSTSFVNLKSNLNATIEAIPEDATDEERYNWITHPNPNERRGHITSINVFDEQGDQRNLKVFLWKSDTNRWTGSVSLDNAEQLNVDVESTIGANTSLPENTRFTLNFTPDGKILSTSDGVDEKNSGNLNVNVGFRTAGNPEIQNVSLRVGNSGTVDGITQFSSPSTTKAFEQDGYSMGYLSGFLIDNLGTVVGTFSNGVKQLMGRVALANFSNPEGLTKKGGTNYEVSVNSGDAIVGEATTQGFGSINAGFLEMSNVDLSDSFTDMIVTQRGFQANSRSITTSDQMLQELLTLKR